MSVSGNDSHLSHPADRPVGRLLPACAEARHVLDALQHENLSEAARQLDAWQPATPLDRAWRLTLSGSLALTRKELIPASIALCQAFTQATILSTDPNEQDGPTAHRLAARALLELGRAYRRQDRFEDARRAHRAAADGIERFGSADETWQVQHELGLDARVAQEHEVAIEHLERALAAVAQCAEESQRKRAVCLTELACVRLAEARWAQAVAKAREAMIAWQEHDISSDRVPKAEALLGTALLRHGESLIETDPQQAQATLVTAMESLADAREALRAFGTEHAPDVALCDEQIDFARRLRASLELGSLKE